MFIETNPFREQDPQYTRRHAASPWPWRPADAGKLIAAAQRALGAAWRDGYRYKKAGVMLIGLVKANAVSSGLFDSRDDSWSQARMKALDVINARFGLDTSAFARTAKARASHMRSDMLRAR